MTTTTTNKKQNKKKKNQKKHQKNKNKKKITHTHKIQKTTPLQNRSSDKLQNETKI